MIQLNILCGKAAGTSQVARRFPVRIGRAATADLRLEDEGVWDEHGVLLFDPAEGFSLRPEQNALMRINGQSTSGAVLRNGDILEAGASRIQFWLTRVHQGSLRLGEALSWSAILAAAAAQIAIIYWLVR